MNTINNQNTAAAILTSPTSSPEAATTPEFGTEFSFQQLLAGQIKVQATGNTATTTNTVINNPMDKATLQKTATDPNQTATLNLTETHSSRLTTTLLTQSRGTLALQASNAETSPNPEQTLSSITANRNTSLNMAQSFASPSPVTTVEHGKVKKSNSHQDEQINPDITATDPTLIAVANPQGNGAFIQQTSNLEADTAHAEQTLLPITANHGSLTHQPQVDTQPVALPAIAHAALPPSGIAPNMQRTELSDETTNTSQSIIQNQSVALPFTPSTALPQLPVHPESTGKLNAANSHELATIESKSLPPISTDPSVAKQSTDTPSSDSFASMMTNTNATVMTDSTLHSTEEINRSNAYLNTGNWQQEINQKVIWMSHSGQQSATLMLNSPELGPLQVVVNVNQAHAQAHFLTDNPQLRQTLEDGMAHLRDMMKQSGVELGQTNVQSGNQNSQPFNPPPQPQRGYTASKASINIERMIPPALATTIQRSGKGMINTFA